MADTLTLPARLRTLDTAATPAPWPPADDVEVRGEDEGLILALRNNVPEILAAFDAAERLARIRAMIEREQRKPGHRQKSRVELHADIMEILAPSPAAETGETT